MGCRVNLLFNNLNYKFQGFFCIDEPFGTVGGTGASSAGGYTSGGGTLTPKELELGTSLSELDTL